MSQPDFIILDCAAEVAALRDCLELKLGREFVEPQYFERQVAHLFTHLMDRSNREDRVDEFIYDTMDVFDTGCNESAKRGKTCTELMTRFAESLMRKLDALGMYNDDGMVDYTFYQFVEDNIMVALIQPH